VTSIAHFHNDVSVDYRHGSSMLVVFAVSLSMKKNRGLMLLRHVVMLWLVCAQPHKCCCSTGVAKIVTCFKIWCSSAPLYTIQKFVFILKVNICFTLSGLVL